jgi:predicted DNA binding CopG/RHH family protein
MKKSRSKIPKFKNEDEEFEFWSRHDTTEFFSETEEVNQKLELSKTRKKRITMLLEPKLKAQLQKIAEEKGIGYQTLIQMWLKEKVNQMIKSSTT